MRACSSNPDAAMLAGINIQNMRTLSFGLMPRWARWRVASFRPSP